MMYHRCPPAGNTELRHRAQLSIAVVLIGRRFHLKPNIAKTIADLAGYPTSVEG